MAGVSVYYLIDPTSQEVRYIGYSKNVNLRFKNHLLDKRISYKYHWISSLLRSNLKPILVVKCVLETQREAQRVEIALIAKLEARGVSLTNATDGGDGGDTFSLNPNREQRREKHRLAALNNKYATDTTRSEEQRQNYRDSWTPERKEAHARKLSISMIGNTNAVGVPHPWSEKQRENMKASLTPEVRGLMSFKTQERKPKSISGVRGVTRDRGRWRVTMRIKGKDTYLGAFDDINEAIKVRKEAEDLYYIKKEEVQS